MKRLLKFVGCLIVTVLVLTSCDKMKEYAAPSVDKAVIIDYMDAALNPLMTSVDEVTIYHTDLIKEYEIDEVFRTIPIETVRNIANVLIKNNGSVTKKEIVYEYKNNRHIYDNLPNVTNQISQESPKPNPDVSPTVTVQPNHPNLPPPSITTKIKDDTINGIPVTVTTKTETTYEQK